MAHRAVGLAAPADAELARRLPGAAASGHRPRRLHDRAPRSPRSSSATPATSTPRSSTGTTVTRLGRHGDGYEVVTDRGSWTCAAAVIASGGNVAASVPAFAADAAAVDHVGDAARLPHPAVAARRRRARRRGVGDRRPARRGDPRLGPPGDAGGRRARPPAAHVPRAATSSGGSRPPASSTSATTRSTTSCAPATCPRRS